LDFSIRLRPRWTTSPSSKVGIASAAANQVFNDHGYSRSVWYQVVVLWENNITIQLHASENDTALCVGSTLYVDGIEYKYHGYLYYLYRYSIQTYGIKSGFQLFPQP